VADCEWAILCDYAFLDLNRKTCMIGTFDKVFTPSVPSVLHHAALAVKFSGAAGESVNFRVQILRPQPISAELAAFNIAGLPLPDYGAYAFNIYSGQALLKVITFVVDRPPQPVQQAPQ
jgi:hypothetical protein